MPKRSLRRQRALWRDLFGPGPKPSRHRKRSVPRQAVATDHTHVQGNCGMCGNICSPVVPWTCPWCGVTYPPVDIDAGKREAWVAGVGGVLELVTMEA